VTEEKGETAARAAYGDAAIWRIALPMIVSSATTPLLGMVDTAVVGHLDQPHHLGGVAVGATIFTVLFTGMNFLRMGTTGVTAQASGSRNGDELRLWLAQALLMALAFAAMMIVVQPLLLSAALQLLGPGEDVAASTSEYFSVRIWSAPASLANLVLIGWLLGMQNGRGPLAMTLVTNGANILLDLLFVVVAGMEARGVALATLIAEIAGLGTGIVYVRSELARVPGRLERAALVDFLRYRRLLAINANLFLRTLSLMFVFAFITAQGARAGDTVLAANAILMNLQYLLAYALDGIANAAEALVGRAVGARDPAALRLTVQRCLRWSLVFAAIFAATYAVLGNQLISAMTSIGAVAATAREFLPWLVLSPLVSVWAFLYDGVFVGATWPREMRLVMMASTFGVFLPAWYLSQPLGNHGLWLAFTIFMAARGLGMHWRYGCRARQPLRS